MDYEHAKTVMDLATDSARKQIEMNQLSLTNNLDAADRIIMRKAAEATIIIAQAPETDPT